LYRQNTIDDGITTISGIKIVLYHLNTIKFKGQNIAKAMLFKVYKNQLGIYYLSFSKSNGRYSFIYRNSIVKVPITEPIKPPKKLINNPDCLIIFSSFFSSKLGESTTFKR